MEKVYEFEKGEVIEMYGFEHGLIEKFAPDNVDYQSVPPEEGFMIMRILKDFTIKIILTN